jgi:hypothetical protein
MPRRVLLIFLSLVLALASWSAVYAEDFYVVPTFRNNYAPVPKTGQTATYSPRDDGALLKGVEWPSPRFTDNLNGTVTDKLTGLIWQKDANAFGAKIWTEALSDADALASGSHGLTDGSKAGDWRLPNIRELQSLIDYGRFGPALPKGYPFTGVQPSYYWSSTSFTGYDTFAWGMQFSIGNVEGIEKANEFGVICVRGGS